MSRIERDSIFVGHSLGPAFILSVLERLEHPVRASFFVSGFVGALGNQAFDNINRSFVERPFDYQKIRSNCRKFMLFHADNDPYVPVEKARELAERLGGTLEIVKGAGHFNEAAGYTKFELLLSKIAEELSA